MTIKLRNLFILTLLLISGFIIYQFLSLIFNNQDQTVEIKFGENNINLSGNSDMNSGISANDSKRQSAYIPQYGNTYLNPKLKSTSPKQVKTLKSNHSAKSQLQNSSAASYSYSASSISEEVEIYSGNNALPVPQNRNTIRRSNKEQNDLGLHTIQAHTFKMLQTSRKFGGAKFNPIAAATGVESMASTTLDKRQLAIAETYETTDYVDPGDEDPVFLPIGDGMWLLLVMSLSFACYKRRSSAVN